MVDPVDELYLLPLREFIAARDRLAARLAAAKQRERARQVKALRRPSVAAWVVNQLAHRNAPQLRRLIDAGEALRKAQRRVVRGGGADDFRQGTKRRQEALRELRRAAEVILRDAGAGAHLDDVLATLETASIDPGAARAVVAGRMSRELPRPSGFGDAVPLTLVVSRAAIPAPRPGREPGSTSAARVAADRRRARERAAEAKRLARDAAASERNAQRLSRRAATLERARRSHERRVHRLRDELHASERRLREVQAEVARARAEASRAAERAADLRRSADETHARADGEE